MQLFLLNSKILFSVVATNNTWFYISLLLLNLFYRLKIYYRNELVLYISEDSRSHVFESADSFNVKINIDHKSYF